MRAKWRESSETGEDLEELKLASLLDSAESQESFEAELRKTISEDTVEARWVDTLHENFDNVLGGKYGKLADENFYDGLSLEDGEADSESEFSDEELEKTR